MLLRTPGKSRLLTGWRKDVVGTLLQALFSEQTTRVVWDSSTGRVSWEPNECLQAQATPVQA